MHTRVKTLLDRRRAYARETIPRDEQIRPVPPHHRLQLPPPPSSLLFAAKYGYVQFQCGRANTHVRRGGGRQLLYSGRTCSRNLVEYLSHSRCAQQRADQGKLAQKVENDGKEVAAIREKQIFGQFSSSLTSGSKPAQTHPKRFKNPNISKSIPMNVHRKNTMTIPVKKHTVPLIFCLRAKK